MARDKNISGLDAMKQATNKTAASSGDANTVEPHLNDLQESFSKGHLFDAKAALSAAKDEQKELIKGAKELDHISLTSQRVKLEGLQKQEILERKHIFSIKNSLSIEENLTKINVKRIENLKTELTTREKTLKANLKAQQYETNSLSNMQRGIALRQQENREFQRGARTAHDHIRVIENHKKQSFAHALGRTSLNPAAALRMFGQQKIQAGMATEGGISMGGVAGGAAALGTGIVVGMIVSKLVDVFKRSITQAIDIGDISKTARATGTSSASFRSTLNQSLSGYGVSIEEKVALAKQLRPLYGKEQQGGQFAEALRSGVMFDRAFGSELGTGNQLVGSLARYTSTGQNPNDINKVLGVVADSLGRGRLIGLQEEMLQGIMQLVDLTKSSSVGGADPRQFADMIADISGLEGNKNLRGAQAAQFISQMSQGMANPQTNFAQITTQMGLQSALAKLHKEGKISRMPSPSELLLMQKAGVAAEFEGQNVGMAGMTEAMKANLSLTGDKSLSALALSTGYGVNPQQAAFLQKHLDLLGTEKGENFRQQFGLETPTSVGGMVFRSHLAEQYKNAGSPAELTSERKTDILNKALDSYSTTLDTSKQKELANLRSTTTGMSMEQRLQKYQEFAQSVQTGGPEDAIRNTLVGIDEKIQQLVEYVIPAVVAIAARFAGGKSYEQLKKEHEQEKVEKAAGEKFQTELSKMTPEEARKAADAQAAVGQKNQDEYTKAQVKTSLKKLALLSNPITAPLALAVKDPERKWTAPPDLSGKASVSQMPVTTSNIDLGIKTAPFTGGSVVPPTTPSNLNVSNVDLGGVDNQRTLPESVRTDNANVRQQLSSLKGYTKEQNQALIASEAKKQGIDERLALAVAQHESNFKADAAGVDPRSGKIAGIGLMQVTRSTGKDLGVNVYDREDNVRGGVSYLKQLIKRYGSEEEALKHYYGKTLADGKTPDEAANEAYAKSILKDKEKYTPEEAKSTANEKREVAATSKTDVNLRHSITLANQDSVGTVTDTQRRDYNYAIPQSGGMPVNTSESYRIKR
jgi:hypothetical protein